MRESKSKYSMFGVLETPRKEKAIREGEGLEPVRTEQKQGGGADAESSNDPWEVSLIRDNTPSQKIVCNYGFESPSPSERSRFGVTPMKSTAEPFPSPR